MNSPDVDGSTKLLRTASARTRVDIPSVEDLRRIFMTPPDDEPYPGTYKPETRPTNKVGRVHGTIGARGRGNR